MIPIALETDRLILRRANAHDAEVLFNNYLSVEENSRFLTRAPYSYFKQAENFLKTWCDIPWDGKQDKFGWVIASIADNKAIGIFLVEVEERGVLQIHYGISKLYENQGLITEAGKAVIGWLRAQDKVDKIEALCDLENTRSAGVLKKLGFRGQCILKDRLVLPAFGLKPRDCYYFVYEDNAL
jgi:RimJ/RimL family protein N-acetyltransferase